MASAARQLASFATTTAVASDENTGIRLIEVPCLALAQYQCREIALLNLYILSRNGDPEALKQWNEQVSPVR